MRMAVPLLVFCLWAAACNGSGGESDAGPADATMPLQDGEPAICAEFTEAGAPCPAVSPVRCFPECEAGGCYCQNTPGGRVWVCQTDLSCIPDCAPLEDGCVQLPTGDDGGDGGAGAGDDGGDAAADATATADAGSG